MTAYSMVRLWCDAYDTATGRQCIEKFEVVAPDFARARGIAAEKGWTHVAASGADEGDRCPSHKPEPVQVRPVPEEQQ